MRTIIEGRGSLSTEDGGSAEILEISDDSTKGECGVFLRVHSWCDFECRQKHHPTWVTGGGDKKYRVTIEVV